MTKRAIGVFAMHAEITEGTTMENDNHAGTVRR